MRNPSARLHGLLTALQVMTFILLGAGTLLTVRLGIEGVLAPGVLQQQGILPEGAGTLLPAICGWAFLLAVSALSYDLLLRFVGLCGRLKRARAFTAENERALRRIAIDCFVNAGLMVICPFCMELALGRGLSGFEMMLPILYLWLGAFLFLVVALVFWAVYVLMRRAGGLQREADYTV